MLYGREQNFTEIEPPPHTHTLGTYFPQLQMTFFDIITWLCANTPSTIHSSIEISALRARKNDQCTTNNKGFSKSQSRLLSDSKKIAAIEDRDRKHIK